MHYSHLHMRKKSITADTCDINAVQALVKDGCAKQDSVEYTVFLDNLKDLDDWCQANGKQAFFTYFQDAAIGAFYRFARAKDKTWSDKKTVSLIRWMDYISYASPFLMPVGTYAMAVLEKHADVIADNKIYLFAAGAIGTVILCVLSAARIALCKHKEEEAERNYYETWVRHSLCNSRLQIAMSEFLVSQRSNEDYEKFVNRTFEILNQNIDQFAVNLCPRGAVLGAGKVHDKKR